MAPEPASPYVGLSPYRPADRYRFFGRTSEIEEVRDLWLSHRLVVLYGSSGVGKTSLLNAGVLPALSEPDAKYRADVLPNGRIPQSTAALLPDPTGPNPYVFRLLSSWMPSVRPPEVAGESVAAFLGRQRPTMDEDGYPLPLLVAIDQFEQVFADDLRPADELVEFLSQLATATREVDRLRLLISIRTEQLGLFHEHEEMIGGRHRAEFRVFPLGRAAALQAVTGPLRDTERSFERGVAETLIEHLCTVTITDSVGETTTRVRNSVEPVHLQIACSGLWNSLPASTTRITAAHLQDSGDVADLLLRFGTAAIDDVAAEFGLHPADVWIWLARSFITERGTRGTISEGIAQIGTMPNAVARFLEARRLLRTEDRLGSRWYELAHDQLLDVIRQGASPWWEPAANQIDRSAHGFLRQAQGAREEGRKTVENYALRAVELSKPSDPGARGEALALIARTKAESNEVEEATARYREAIDVYLLLENETAVGRLRAELGRFLYETGDELGALDELTLAVRLVPGDLAAKVGLARVLRDLQQLPGAISMLNTALNIAPDYVEALIERGLLLLARGVRRDAVTDLRNAIRLDPTVAEREDVRAALARLEGS